MVGAFLVDVARRNVTSAASLQSLAFTAKWSGTFTSQVSALLVYARGPGGSLQVSGGMLTARQAIALTAVAPSLIALSVPWLRETRQVSRVTSDMSAIWCC